MVFLECMGVWNIKEFELVYGMIKIGYFVFLNVDNYVR